MLEVTNRGHGADITWDQADDPQGWLSRAVTSGHLQDALAALGDPMDFAQVAADDERARDQLRSVSWLLDQLALRRDALTVALKDRGVSWTDLVKLVDPDEPDPVSKRSTMQQRYRAGRKRTGLDSTDPEPQS